MTALTLPTNHRSLWHFVPGLALTAALTGAALWAGSFPAIAYGEYGMFLIRTGQKEASRKLWEDYKEKEKAELLDDSESRNLQLWEEINEKKKRK